MTKKFEENDRQSAQTQCRVKKFIFKVLKFVSSFSQKKKVIFPIN